MVPDFLKKPYDPDMVLRDLVIESDSNEVKAMAALTIGVGIDEAYYSVRELRQAVEETITDELTGSLRLGDILATQCDDYQRAIFYCIAGRGHEKMASLLKEFEEVLLARGMMSRFMKENQKEVICPVSPYTTDRPFGPVCVSDFDVVRD